MHKPWDHANEICELFKNPTTPTKLKEKLRKAITTAHELETLCVERGKKLYEPFEGTDLYGDGSAIVLGPNRAYYQLLVSQFRDTPTASFSVPAILQKAVAAANDAVEWVAEKMDMQYESLDDSGVTSHENNSSVILLLTIDGKKLLLTSDAGIPALTAAADYAASRNIALHDLSFMQVPHHGSKHNVGKTILNRIKAGTAYVSGRSNGPETSCQESDERAYQKGELCVCHCWKKLSSFLRFSQRNTYSGVVSLPSNLNSRNKKR